MRKSIADRVKELERQNSLLTDNLMDVIFVLDAETLKYDYITSSTYKMSGYSAEELINTKITDRCTPESSKSINELLKKELTDFNQKTQVVQSFDLELVHKNGSTYWTQIKAKLLNEPGSPHKIVGIAREVTEKKKYEQQLEIQNNKLIQALADKEALLKEIKVLQTLLPICSGCKRIRDKNGMWWPMEAYVREHTDSDFTHTICTDCHDVYYPELKKKSTGDPG